MTIPGWPEPATPERNAALRAQLERLLDEFDQVQADLATMRETLRSATGEARSKDGSVRVTVGPRGELRDLQLDPAAYRRLSPSELAAEIVSLTAAAGRDVQARLDEVMAPFLPKGVSYSEAVSGQADLRTWFSRQPLNADFPGEWWPEARA